jgi:hypothetical protein
MTTHHDDQTVGVDVLDHLAHGATLAHLRSADAAVQDLLANADRSDPSFFVLLIARQAIQSAQQTLTDSACNPVR